MHAPEHAPERAHGPKADSIDAFCADGRLDRLDELSLRSLRGERLSEKEFDELKALKEQRDELLPRPDPLPPGTRKLLLEAERLLDMLRVSKRT